MKPGARLFLTVLLCLIWPSLAARAHGGRVIDAATGLPVAGAVVSSAGTVTTADAAGRYAFAGAVAPVTARAIGYRRASVNPDSGDGASIRLTSIRPKALYLSFWGIGDHTLRQRALDLVARTELNALVIDVKGDRGGIPYASRVAIAQAAGARRETPVTDMPALMASLKSHGIYLIARIVMFKDNPLAAAKPELAVRTASGAPFRDREGLGWVDPSRREVWAYNLDIAAEAAELGFDEIQFDYFRFPDTKNLVFSVPNDEQHRVAAISGFLAAARERLAPYNVFISADIFGYVLWNLNDTFIGQKLGVMANEVDYLSPMLYPSGFQFGIPGYSNPITHPREIVQLSLERAVARTGLPAARFRPWLQAFRDYAFDRRPFGAEQIRAQIEAAQRCGSGWMLWNPRNTYTDEGLTRK